MTSSASSPDFDRVRQKRSSPLHMSASQRSCTVLTAVQFEAARDHAIGRAPSPPSDVLCQICHDPTESVSARDRSQPICLCLIVKSSQDDSGCGGNARDPRWARKAGR
jgi:hypothetical protein